MPFHKVTMATNDFSTGGPASGYKGQCEHFQQGNCYRIRCKKQHMLPDTDISIKLFNETSIPLTAPVISSTMVNNNSFVALALQDKNVTLVNLQT